MDEGFAARASPDFPLSRPRSPRAPSRTSCAFSRNSSTVGRDYGYEGAQADLSSRALAGPPRPQDPARPGIPLSSPPSLPLPSLLDVALHFPVVVPELRLSLYPPSRGSSSFSPSQAADRASRTLARSLRSPLAISAQSSRLLSTSRGGRSSCSCARRVRGPRRPLARPWLVTASRSFSALSLCSHGFRACCPSSSRCAIVSFSLCSGALELTPPPPQIANLVLLALFAFTLGCALSPYPLRLLVLQR